MSQRIGIEFGSTALHLAVVDSDGTGATASVRLAEVALPEGTTLEGIVADVDAAATALRQAIEEVGIRRPRHGAGVHVALGGLGIVTRMIESADELQAVEEGTLPLDSLPFSAEDAVISSERLHVPEAGGALLLVAVHRELVEPVLEAVESAGLRVEAVDLAAAALVRSLGRTASPDAPEAIVCIGAETTTVAIHVGGSLRFVRTFSLGSAEVTRAISRRLDVPFAHAEELKLRLPTELRDLGGLPPEMLLALRDGSASLLAELETSLRYYTSGASALPLGRVVLTGGGALLPWLTDRIALFVKCPVVLADVLADLELTHPRAEEVGLGTPFAAAIGVAMTPASGIATIDLRPRGRRDLRRAERGKRAGRALVMALPVLLVGLAGLRVVELQSAEHAAGAMQEANDRLIAQMPSYAKAARAHRQMLNDAARFGPIVESEVNWPAVLTALRAATPSSVSSTDFVGTSSSSAPAGVATTAAPEGSHTIGTVTLSLQAAGYPAFEQWFDALSRHGTFQVIQYSGLTSANGAVDFSADLGVVDTVKSSRARAFEVAGR